MQIKYLNFISKNKGWIKGLEDDVEEQQQKLLQHQDLVKDEQKKKIGMLASYLKHKMENTLIEVAKQQLEKTTRT